MTTIESPVDTRPGTAARVLSWRKFAPAGLLTLAPLPLLALHARDLWQRSHYQFFPVVPLGAAILAVPACRRLGPLVPGTRLRTALLLGLSWVLLMVACLLYS